MKSVIERDFVVGVFFAIALRLAATTCVGTFLVSGRAARPQGRHLHVRTHVHVPRHRGHGVIHALACPPSHDDPCSACRRPKQAQHSVPTRQSAATKTPNPMNFTITDFSFISSPTRLFVTRDGCHSFLVNTSRGNDRNRRVTELGYLLTPVGRAKAVALPLAAISGLANPSCSKTSAAACVPEAMQSGTPIPW